MTNTTDKPPPFDIIAFVGALICAPIAVTLVTGVTIIPIFALVFGAPAYLIFGTPVLLWMVGRYPPATMRYALAGLLVNAMLCGVIFLADRYLPTAKDSALSETLSLALWGLLFAPIWAGTFAPLYRRFNRMARLVPQS